MGRHWEGLEHSGPVEVKMSFKPEHGGQGSLPTHLNESSLSYALGPAGLGQAEGRKAHDWSSFSICVSQLGETKAPHSMQSPRHRAWHTVGAGKSKAVTC